MNLSRRALLQRESAESAAKAMNDIVAGAVLRGTVSARAGFDNATTLHDHDTVR